MAWTEENIESFIVENKDEFDKYDPSSYHENNFLRKLSFKVKIIISIVPYLIRLILIWCVITAFSIWVWNDAIRKDKHEITLKQKIENIITFKK